MKKNFSKIFIPVIILSLFYGFYDGGGFVNAQEAPAVVEEASVITAEVPADAPTATNEVPLPAPVIEEPTITAQQIDIVVQVNEAVVQESASSQETAPSQETVESATLENTTDLTQTPTAESIITDIIPQPDNSASSEADVVNVAPSEVTVVENLNNNTLINQENVVNDNLVLPNQTVAVVQNIAEVELKPRGEYTFALAGEKILTKKKPKWQKPGEDKDEDFVNAQPNLVIDNGSGTLTVSGECSSAYFVILLYKNEDGYDNDPSSYVLNRAYPCENNTYYYSISSLPSSLAAGTYYLLIAEQGERGPWKPISVITPVLIQ